MSDHDSINHTRGLPRSGPLRAKGSPADAAEEALRLAEHLNLLMESTDEGIYGIDWRGRCTFVNRSAAQMLGYQPDELLGESMHRLVHHTRSDGSPYPVEECPIYRAFEGNRGIRVDSEVFWRVDGTPIPVEYSSYPIVRDRIVEGAIVTFVDVTERRRAEEKLKEREERFRLLAENAKDVIFRYRIKPTPGFEYVSPSATALTGYTPEEHYADPELGLKLVHPEDMYILEDFLRSPESADKLLTLRWVSRDGKVLWTEQQINPVYDAQGDMVAVEGIGRNITERKEVEASLRRSEERFRSLVQNASDIIMILEADGTIRYVSPAIENVLGLQTEDAVGRKAVAFVHPVDRAEAIRVFAEAGREPGIRPTGEFRLRHESGAWRYLEINRTNLLDDPAVGGIVLNLRDVTEQKQAEKEVERRAHQQAVVAELGLWALANEDLQSLMDDTVALIAQTLEVEYCKIMEPLPNGEKLLMRAGVGWEKGLVGSATEGADLISQSGYTLNSAKPVILEDLRTETRFKSSTLLQEHGVVSGMSVVIAGREKPFGILQVHTRSLRSFSEDDVNFLQATANLLAMAIERKEAKESLEEVREAERSRIARDLHDQALQDLARAKAQAQLLRMTPQEPEIPHELSRRLDGLSGALVRAEQEVRAAIYDLSLEAEQQRPFSELLTILVEIQRTMAPETQISLQMENDTLNEPLEERGRQLLRVVGEAITNARRHSGAHNILIAVWSTEETFYAEVKDDGKGFELAQESLATHTGGMGIRGMHERARLLGADLNIESAPGEGTKVRLELALKKDREELTEKVSILLVEDHATVREAVATSFQQEGFEIVGQAESLAEARRVLRARPVDVALIDLGLPDGYGADLIKELREAHPRAQALVLSASLDRAEIARAVERGAAGILNKSAHLDEVVDSVRRLRAGATLLSLKEVAELLRYAVSRREEENEARQAIEKLTSREIEVLRALAEGLDSEGVADKLHIALRTERNHVANILAKLGVHSQLQALVFVLRHGVVEIPQRPRGLR